MGNKFDDDNNEEKGRDLGTILKKLISSGMEAKGPTQELLKGILSEVALPRDLVAGLLQNAKGAKEELLQAYKQTLEGHLNSIRPERIFRTLLDDYEVELNAKIKFKKKASAKKGASTSKKKTRGAR